MASTRYLWLHVSYKWTSVHAQIAVKMQVHITWSNKQTAGKCFLRCFLFQKTPSRVHSESNITFFIWMLFRIRTSEQFALCFKFRYRYCGSLDFRETRSEQHVPGEEPLVILLNDLSSIKQTWLSCKVLRRKKTLTSHMPLLRTSEVGITLASFRIGSWSSILICSGWF
jgi:hypothetical protein